MGAEAATQEQAAAASEFLSGYLPYPDQLEANVETPNYSIYDKRLTADPPTPGFEREPYTVYFYYVRLDTDGRLKVNHYTKTSQVAIPHASLESVVQELVDNARIGNNDNPAPDGHNFKDIEWTRISYVAFFVDEENWNLHKNGDPLEGVRFNTAGDNTPNHSFFDGIDLNLTGSNDGNGEVDQRTAIACVNHLKRNAQGDDLGENGQEEQRFKFEMVFDVTFSDQSPAPLIAIFDPTGTNLGPRIPPP